MLSCLLRATLNRERDLKRKKKVTLVKVEKAEELVREETKRENCFHVAAVHSPREPNDQSLAVEMFSLTVERASEGGR